MDNSTISTIIILILLLVVPLIWLAIRNQGVQKKQDDISHEDHVHGNIDDHENTERDDLGNQL